MGDNRVRARIFRTMKLGVLCFIVVAAGTARSALYPAGEHVCLHNESYIDVIEELQVILVPYYVTEWCWSVPPRCTVEKKRIKTVPFQKEVTRVREVPKCCTGYREYSRRCVPVCSNPCLNGRCTAPEKCSCHSGFKGNRCEKLCDSGTWGKDCLEVCNCQNNATCRNLDGKCFCTPGWQGKRCESPCEPGFYGTDCKSRCECGGELCDHVSGICETTTKVAITTTESTSSETTTVTEDLSHSTESTVTESSTIAGTDQVEDSTVDDPPSSTNNLIRVYLGEENTVTHESNENAKDNEIESAQDLTHDEIRVFSLYNILGNLSIICGVFLLIFVVTMSSVMVSHYRKIRKTGYEFNGRNNNSNTQNFPVHRFYGGPTLPSRAILDNQVCSTNVDFRVEQPILMTFKPLPDEQSKADHILTSVESNMGVFDTDSALARQSVRVRCDEPKSLAYISTRCKSV